LLVVMVDRGLGYVSVVGFPGRNRCMGSVSGFRVRGFGAIKALSAGGVCPPRRGADHLSYPRTNSSTSTLSNPSIIPA